MKRKERKTLLTHEKACGNAKKTERKADRERGTTWEDIL